MNDRLAKSKNRSRAVPVMIPGSASGSTSRNEIVSRPKKRKRATAAAAIVPSTSAIPVVTSATLTESQNAARASALCQVTLNQCSVQLEIGQPWMFDLLKA